MEPNIQNGGSAGGTGRKKILLLGATGSIGATTLEIIEKFPERFELCGFSYHENREKAQEIQRKFNAPYVCTTGKNRGDWEGEKCSLLTSDELMNISYDTLVSAVVGAAGVELTVKAVSDGKEILLANKESLVMAGGHIMKLAEKSGSKILPVDSEHNSVFRLLRDGREIRQVTLTASGGALRSFPKERVAKAKVADVLNHPTWSMGDKITVDSATMVNKALEIIEAHHLFGLPYDKLGAVIHSQSFVHAIIEEGDGSFSFHVYPPDMSYSIAYCMFYPDPSPLIRERLRIKDFPDLQFDELDPERYRSYFLGHEAGRRGGTFPAVFNAANEVAVELFLEGKIEFGKIPGMIESALEGHEKRGENSSFPELQQLFEVDRAARSRVREVFA